ATGTDNCDASLTVTFTDIIIPSAGCPSISRTWTITDDCGNKSSCMQSILVTNNSSISIICPGTAAVQCASQVPAVNTGSVSAAGGCGGNIVVAFISDVVSNQTC